MVAVGLALAQWKHASLLLTTDWGFAHVPRHGTCSSSSTAVPLNVTGLKTD